MQVQQISVKVFASRCDIDREALIPIFHGWIRDQRLGDEILIDVADYRHVPKGPGVMLIAHEAHYGLDEGAGRPGLLYGRKRDPIGDARDKLRAALRAALTACAELQAEPSVADNLSFSLAGLEIQVMSRLCARNTDEDFERLRPVLDQVLRPLLADVGDSVTLDLRRVGSEAQPLTIWATCTAAAHGPDLQRALSLL